MQKPWMLVCLPLILAACSNDTTLLPGSLSASAVKPSELTLKLKLDYPAKLQSYIGDLPLRMDVVTSVIPMYLKPFEGDVNMPDSDKNYKADLMDSQEVPLGKDFEYTFKAQDSRKIVSLNAYLRFYFDGNRNGIYDSGEITCIAPTPELSWSQENRWELLSPTVFSKRPYLPPNPFNQLSYSLLSPEHAQYQKLTNPQDDLGIDVVLPADGEVKS